MSINDSSNTSLTDWATLEAMTDEEIDYSDIPPLTDEFFESAMLRVPAAQADNLIQLDPEVMAWFRSQGAEYRSLINSVLRCYYGEQLQQQQQQPLQWHLARRISLCWRCCLSVITVNHLHPKRLWTLLRTNIRNLLS